MVSCPPYLWTGFTSLRYRSRLIYSNVPNMLDTVLINWISGNYNNIKTYATISLVPFQRFNSGLWPLRSTAQLQWQTHCTAYFTTSSPQHRLNQTGCCPWISWDGHFLVPWSKPVAVIFSPPLWPHGKLPETPVTVSLGLEHKGEGAAGWSARCTAVCAGPRPWGTA